ncbi:MAG: hypothetical protein UV05_C0019G0002 [candidate division CPR1 bacterium GW2011_GWA2_42_17]|uniref:Uncharacterized protein n=1 Tax=candidate division CPR1 bacterium GW2011_GWA2_42_17 TaxID=1618341 RepID=A0A0G1C2F8_9BACT|nr:MAG: hypothetical protein UV05_C0019G0002 [candidate division CPR1 bacterium GW2011_GWA2_42_17]
MDEILEKKPVMHMTKPKGKLGKWLTLGVGTLAVLFIVFLALDSLVGWGIIINNKKPWTAVFLTNGQVYFGHMSKTGGDVVLKDIYYIQTNQAAAAANAQTQQQPNLSLVKLGNELHGPVDLMRINKQQIILTEEMKEDAQVVKSIYEYIKNQEKK